MRLVLLLVMMWPVGTNASLITEKLYDTTDIYQQFQMFGETRYIAFKSLKDVFVQEVVNAGSVALPVTNASYTYQLFETDENWIAVNGNADRLWLHQGMVQDLGALGYADEVGVQLLAGHYYRIAFSAYDWIQDIYTGQYDTGSNPLSVFPYETENDSFRIVGAGVRALGNDFMGLNFRIHAVPAPSSLYLLVLGFAGLGYSMRTKT